MTLSIPTWSFHSPLALVTMLPFLALNPFSIVWTLHESEGEQGGNYLLGKIPNVPAEEKIRIVRAGSNYEIEFWLSENNTDANSVEQQMIMLTKLVQASDIQQAK